jgi:hypothetical protein
MTDTSPILAMPYIQPSQAQKHVTHNEALSLLDVIVQLAVLSADQSVPPTTAVEGDRYLVAPNGQAAWAGQDGKIAAFVDAGWHFTSPLAGWVAQVLDTGSEVRFDGAAWVGKTLSNLPGLGIGASFDSYNRLVVSSDAVLLNHAGGGHQLKINKDQKEDTASLVFQTGYGGRAEMGIAGSDDFALKVSADGSNWVEALRVDAATGRIRAGVGGWREMLIAPRSYFVDPAMGFDGNAGMSAGVDAFATIAKAIEVALLVDSGGHDITVHLADGTYGLPQTLAITRGLIGGGQLVVQGNMAAPGTVVIEALECAIEVSERSIILRGITLQNASATSPAVSVKGQGHMMLDHVIFGTAGGHLEVDNACLSLEGPCEIAGDAGFHLSLSGGAVFDSNGHPVSLTGTPDFLDAFCICAEASVARLSGQSFVGAATGKQFDLSSNGVINSGGAVLPGDVAGTAQTGGLHI